MIGDQSRRAFLARSACLGGAGVAAPFVTSLAALGEAAASAATPSDYKALVCVFLYGGNDNFNTLPPYDPGSHAQYAGIRPALALPRDALAATALTPSTAVAGGRQFALHPSLAPLLPLFNAGRMAAVLNVGTLVRPTTKAEYVARSTLLPPKLFSHNDQQSYWQASGAEGAPSGWGGKMGDLLQSGNGTATLTCITPAGNAVFLTGRSAVQYAIGAGGPIALSGGSSLFGSATAASALKNLMTAPASGLMENEHGRVSRRALDTHDMVSTALAAAPALTTPFPTGNSLADQLRVVARLVSVASALGARRQVFFTSLGGFDMHSGLIATQATLLTRVAEALRAFHDATQELGVADKVTAFTASDFGRALVPNNDGSDHGWGSTHFVVGGAVQGKRIYGAPPAIASNGPDDVGQGRLLPSTSVDQYAATLAQWFGVSSANELTGVLPNLSNYNSSGWNLGFV